MTNAPGRVPRPDIALGMVTYNGERHVRQAIESLLAQTWTEFRLTIVDDASTDGTVAIAEEFAARDPRLRVVRNPRRLGYIGNSVAAFEHAASADLFAWASDHDVHAPEWLETLVTGLMELPDAVLAYPLTVRISDTGQRLDTPPPRFETRDLPRVVGALAVAGAAHGFGNMVYGLFRVPALRAAGVMRRVLLPDTMLITEIARFGSIVQVPRELWQRRYVGLFSLERQRKTLFADVPWYAHLSPLIVNPLILAWNVALKPGAGNMRDRWLGARMTWRFAWRGLAVATFPRIRSHRGATKALRAVYRTLAR
jgi:glycosyltransferase involved in cell wall biosynthesis